MLVGALVLVSCATGESGGSEAPDAGEDRIPPDEALPGGPGVPGQPRSLGERDPAVDAARRWLASTAARRSGPR